MVGRKALINLEITALTISADRTSNLTQSNSKTLQPPILSPSIFSRNVSHFLFNDTVG